MTRTYFFVLLDNTSQPAATRLLDSGFRSGLIKENIISVEVRDNQTLESAIEIVTEKYELLSCCHHIDMAFRVMDQWKVIGLK